MSLLPATAIDAAVTMGSVSLKKIKQAVAAGSRINSLVDVSRPARVEPMVMVEKSLTDQPFMTDVMKFCLTNFTGYWVQAFSLSMNVGRIDTLKVLDALNPNRNSSVVGNVRDAVFSAESYAQGLPSMEAFEQPMDDARLIVSAEAESGTVDDESVKKFYEVDNLAIGKLVTVEVRDGKESAKVPVMIRLVPTEVPSKSLVHIFTATSKNKSFKERYHLWRSGQIRMVRDLMFGMDLIDQHRKALINDSSNVYMTLSKRRSNNVVSAVSSGTPSIADASNIAVITKETAKDMGREMYGKIEQQSVRQKIFDSTYLMMLVVVDERWERLSVYHRGIDQPTEVSFREIKNSEKGKGPDITEILKAYQLGNTPTI